MIAVCMKWVAVRPDVDPITGAVLEDSRWSGPSMADQGALEWSLRIAQAWSESVVVFTVGGPESEPMLRDALAVGATKAVRVDVSGAPLGSATVAGALAGAILAQASPAVLVLCGDWSLDRGSASVPPFLAAHLNIGQACGLVSLALKPPERGAQSAARGSLRCERRLDGGRREVLDVSGPAVLSVEGAVARLRRATTAAVLAARRATIDVISSASAGVADGSDGSSSPRVIGTRAYRPRARILQAPAGENPRDRLLLLTGASVDRTPPQRLVLDGDVAAEKILTQLRAWGYLDDNNQPT